MGVLCGEVVLFSKGTVWGLKLVLCSEVVLMQREIIIPNDRPFSDLINPSLEVPLY